MTDTVERIGITPSLRVRIVVDEYPSAPTDWDNLGEITYASRSRNVLGTEAIGDERFEEIGRLIDKGELIGLPVYAYVHSGATIATTPFSCPWDSGRSGWVYCTREKAIAEFGKKLLTKKVRQHALAVLKCEVETFAQYLEGSVYGFIVEHIDEDDDGDVIVVEELDSCWSLYGLDYAREEAKVAGKAQLVKDTEEAVEIAYWAARDVLTVGARA